VTTFAALAFLAVLLIQIIGQGASFISLRFLTSLPSTLAPETGGIYSPLWGTIWVICLTGILAVPVGVAAAVYLEEYAPKNRLTRLIQLNIANLAGVPSIVYGILGLAVFIRMMHLGRSVLAGSLTMSLLVLPVIIIASRESLAAVPDSIRQAAYALGATRWQVTRYHVLPAAIPGIMTGVILALSRAIGEAAPLIMIGALTYVAYVPRGLGDAFTALPIQIYNWSSQPDPVFHQLAAAAIIVLLALLLSMNAVAIAIRSRQQRK
jgi:phosphate transport system permease protein